MTRRDDGKRSYEHIQWELGAKGQMHRASISPSEKKICFEYLAGAKFTEPGHTLYVVSVAEGAFFDFAHLRWVTFCGAVELSMSTWARYAV